MVEYDVLIAIPNSIWIKLCLTFFIIGDTSVYIFWMEKKLADDKKSSRYNFLTVTCTIFVTNLVKKKTKFWEELIRLLSLHKSFILNSWT
jgi:hypothetical protein